MSIPNTTSRVHVTVNALIAALQARDNIQKDGVQVADGIPGQPQPEAIIVLGVDGWRQEWSLIASSSTVKEEFFTINVRIRVLRGRLAVTEARARAFELLTELEETIRTDKEIASSVWVANLERGEYVNAQDGQNTEAVLNMAIECRARI